MGEWVDSVARPARSRPYDARHIARNSCSPLLCVRPPFLFRAPLPPVSPPRCAPWFYPVFGGCVAWQGWGGGGALDAGSGHSLSLYSSASNVAVMKGYVNPAKILGNSKERYRVDEKFCGRSDTLPEEMAYMHLYWREETGIPNVNVVMKVELKYYVKWFDRVPLGRS